MEATLKWVGVPTSFLALLLLMMTLALPKTEVKVDTFPRTQPTPQKPVVVVADDDPAELARTKSTLEGAGITVFPAPSAVLVFSFAMTGKSGNQVDAVFLDGFYTSPDAPGPASQWVMPNDPFDTFATGPLLAQTLRMMGFRGQLYLVTTNPKELEGEQGMELFKGISRKDKFGEMLSGWLTFFR